MSWQKKGLIFQNDTSLWWSKKYAGIPTVDVISDDILRIYYYSMDEKMDGRISFIEVEAKNPSTIIHIEKEPALDIGEAGTFDDCGVCPSTILKINNKKYLFYLGVQRTEKTPYMYFAGMAVQTTDNKFKRLQKTPVLDRTEHEPYTRSATTIIKIKEHYRMWYVSAFEWFKWNNKLYPKYILRTATSTDGFNWNTENTEVIKFKNNDEFGFGRPWTVFEDDVYKLYYSIRSVSTPYKLGYAESVDGLTWERKDELMNLPCSKEGWDSEMICYPCVVNTKHGKYLFYNGNSHGASGFGYAKWEG